MEKARLRKEAQQRAEESVEKKAKIKKIGMIAVAAVVVIAIGYFAIGAVSGIASGIGKAPKMELSATEYDFGTVSQAAGTVSEKISLKNAGTSDLIISKMISSCMCTTAVLVLANGTRSPVFGMHDTPTGWQGRVAPGSTAEIEIKYDPNVHRELRGWVTRTVTVYSNDPFFPTKEIKITAYQTA